MEWIALAIVGSTVLLLVDKHRKWKQFARFLELVGTFTVSVIGYLVFVQDRDLSPTSAIAIICATWLALLLLVGFGSGIRKIVIALLARRRATEGLTGR